MESQNINYAFTGNPQNNVDYLHNGNSSNGGGMQNIESSIDILNRAGMRLTYSSEKLVNLHALLMHLLAQHKDFDVAPTENGHTAAASVQKALVLDLLSTILDSEVLEVENFVDNIQADIVDARQKTYLCGDSTKLFIMLEEKLQQSDESVKKTRYQVADLKRQSTKLQRAFSALRPENWKNNGSVELPAPSPGKMSNLITNLKRQTAEQQRQILKMMEHKSPPREVYLEKKLAELRQNEEQLKLKLHYTEQVSLRMEEASEVVWGRFLEAENSTEVLMGISKELVGKLQVVHFNLNGSLKREAELKSELQGCFRQLDAKDTALKKLEGSIVEHIKKSSEVPILMEKVNLVEEQLKKSELRLKHANDFNEDMQEQLTEMENLVDSLKERIDEAESRAETAEAKVTQLTDTNLELTEEINFLKSNGDSNTKKTSLLEKQVRELEIQVQHSKASSEANQEQQNMLYTAIWDMETLIEDLKSKVAKAESKTESVEDQCIILSEGNMELDKEASFLRSRIKSLEGSLEQANLSKAASAKQINMRTRLIMETVVQLAGERERIQNQLFSLTTENAILIEKLRNAKRNARMNIFGNGDHRNKKVLISENGTSDETHRKASEEAVSLCEVPGEVNEVTRDASPHETEADISLSTPKSADMASNLEVKGNKVGKRGSLTRALKVVFVALFGVVIYMMLKNEESQHVWELWKAKFYG
ncbi:WPP domain-interacting protein 2 [Euphorbia peplus]|nr:WPP domain-interacting protein 2 [Euphorbia peplus]